MKIIWAHTMTDIKSYANPCPCGGIPICESHTDHLWQGQYRSGFGYHCPKCRNSVSVTGGRLPFALHHWNETYSGPNVTGELTWEWLVMGGRIAGQHDCVAIDEGMIVNPVNGNTLHWPFRIQTWILPANRISIRLDTPRYAKDRSKTLRDIEIFVTNF